MIRVSLGLLAAFLIVVAAARLAYSVNTAADDSQTAAPWTQHEMQFVAWNKERWTTWVRGDEFELDPVNRKVWSRHAKGSIAYIDWNGEPWQAKIDGDEFLLAPQGDWGGSVERSDAIRYRDWSGHRQLRTVPELRR